MKLCECGCGNPVPIADRNRKEMGWIKGQSKRFISGHNKRGLQNPNWKGGVFKGAYKQKYSLRYAPGHPRCCIGNHVLEHILIAEKALGKPLPSKSVVHHYSSEQLIICQDQAYHMLLHRRTKALNSCGYASWRKCRCCKQYDAPEKLHILPSGPAYHSDCQKKHLPIT